MHHYGGADVWRCENAPRPEPGDGVWLMRVHAAAGNPVDWKRREGNLTARLAYPLPCIPGWDVSDTVAAAGPGVTKLQNGNERRFASRRHRTRSRLCRRSTRARPLGAQSGDCGGKEEA